MTNHVLFIHGVNTRQDRDQEGYSDSFFQLIKSQTDKTANQIELYWGDVNKDEETKLFKMWTSSPAWDELWLQEFRQYQLLQFIGDAALYLSRAVGKKIVSTLYEQLFTKFNNVPESHELHIVAHSWGTVILFDILFAARWDGDNEVEAIRKKIYGVTTNASSDEFKEQGYKISSIHTMGSPLSIYQLMQINIGNNTHEISTRLGDFIRSIHIKNKKPLTWNNYIHPCDPVSYPLEVVLPNLLGIENKKEINVSDIVLSADGIFNFIYPFSQTSCALLLGGQAHSSYWQNAVVAEYIVSSWGLENEKK